MIEGFIEGDNIHQDRVLEVGAEKDLAATADISDEQVLGTSDGSDSQAIESRGESRHPFSIENSAGGREQVC